MTTSAITTPNPNVGLLTPPCATHASVTANAIAPRIEPSEMKRVMATVAMKTPMNTPNAGGDSASRTPAVLGHVFTVFAGFKGGKGVATTVGVLLALSPPAFGVFMGVFIATVAMTRFISLGSILGAVAFAVTLAWVAHGGVKSPTFGFGVVIALVVILRHQENIRRLLKGEERQFAFRGGAR